MLVSHTLISKYSQQDSQDLNFIFHSPVYFFISHATNELTKRGYRLAERLVVTIDIQATSTNSSVSTKCYQSLKFVECFILYKMSSCLHDFTWLSCGIHKKYYHFYFVSNDKYGVDWGCFGYLNVEDKIWLTNSDFISFLPLSHCTKCIFK